MSPISARSRRPTTVEVSMLSSSARFRRIEHRRLPRRQSKTTCYIGTGRTVKFSSGKIGDIVLYCPVSASLGFTPSVLDLTYYDDTAAAGNHVTVQLIKMDMSTGGITSIVTIDSNKGLVTANGKASLTGHEFKDTFDPKNFAYYLRIDVIRNSRNANETVYGVALQD